MEKLICKSCGVEELPTIKKNSLHTTAFCYSCGSYIKHLPKDREGQADFKLFFGKYKGKLVSELIKTTEGANYLRWLWQNATILKEWQIAIIRKQLND